MPALVASSTSCFTGEKGGISMTVASKAEEGKGGFFWQQVVGKKVLLPSVSRQVTPTALCLNVWFFENQIRPLAYHTTYATGQEKHL